VSFRQIKKLFIVCGCGSNVQGKSFSQGLY